MSLAGPAADGREAGGKSAAPIPLTDAESLEEACGRELAVIYKHSPRCGASVSAAREMARFAETAPEIPVYVLDVVRDRALAREVAVRLGVTHESPQVIVLRSGKAVWDASHREVTAAALSRELGSARR